MAGMRTSHSHPLKIATVQLHSDHGRIGITFCPGKHDQLAATGSWSRDLEIDLDVIQEWGASLVLTLVEPAELVALKVPHLGEEVLRRGMQWLHMPIADFSVPDDEFEANWNIRGRDIRAMLRRGDSILIHCKGGLGRAGMMAARLLVEMGAEPKEAIRTVRRERRGAIETYAQLTLVSHTRVISEE